MSEEQKPKPKQDVPFFSFLENHSLSNGKVIAILKEFGVTSLKGLSRAISDSKTLTSLIEKIKPAGEVAISNLNKLEVEAIENAIFYSENVGAESEAKTLGSFLKKHGVKVGDKLLFILRDADVHSLESLKAFKKKTTPDPSKPASRPKQPLPGEKAPLTDEGALAKKIEALTPGDWAKFTSITVEQVATALRVAGGAVEADKDLKAFLKKKGLPASAEKVLADFGITTLRQLKDVKQNPTEYDKLKKELVDEGLPRLTKQFDDITVDDIEYAIAEVSSPESKAAENKTTKLKAAITKVEELRQSVVKATDKDFDSVKATVDKEFSAVLNTIKDVSGGDFKRADKAALATQDALSTLLTNTIENLEYAQGILEKLEKNPDRLLVTIIQRQYMLCGFLINPSDTIAKIHNNLVSLPENLDKVIRDPGAETSMTITYKGSETNSFAASSAAHSSSTLATAMNSSGAGFVGTGVAAVSAAASYADAQKASREEQTFESATHAKCGEIHYIYVPKQVVLFDKSTIRLSDSAKNSLKKILEKPKEINKRLTDEAGLAEEILKFFDDYGSHFFLKYVLGGRYEFSAKGESASETGKGLLITAVAETRAWAASSSASYAGIGGAASAAASGKGEKTEASANGERFARQFDSAKVEVKTSVLGGVGLAPRDIWSQSLQYNSTWAVIDREEPIEVWKLVGKDEALKDLAPLLERIWVREIFTKAVQQSYPALYHYLKSKPNIDNCILLNKAVKDVSSKEPDVEIVVVKQTSERAEHPRVIAGSNKEGLKLIGGGAMVDYGKGAGNLLTGSYPEGKNWVASAKSHIDSSLGTVTAYAIYLFDPFNLWEVKMVSAKTSQKSDLPEVTVFLPDGYALTGGGALVQGSADKGILLTKCCPAEKGSSYTGWTAKGKDHGSADSGTATAWVFGIRPMNGSKLTDSKVYRQLGQKGKLITLERGGGEMNGEVIVGGGCAVTYTGSGGLLTGSGPTQDYKEWKAGAKDHKYPDTSLDLSLWVICRKGITWRNKLINELVDCTSGTDSYYQSLNDNEMADAEAVLAYYRETGHTDQEIKGWNTDEMRNGVITEINKKRGSEVKGLQGKSTIELIKLLREVKG